MPGSVPNLLVGRRVLFGRSLSRSLFFFLPSYTRDASAVMSPSSPLNEQNPTAFVFFLFFLFSLRFLCFSLSDLLCFSAQNARKRTPTRPKQSATNVRVVVRWRRYPLNVALCVPFSFPRPACSMAFFFFATRAHRRSRLAPPSTRKRAHLSCCHIRRARCGMIGVGRRDECGDEIGIATEKREKGAGGRGLGAERRVCGQSDGPIYLVKSPLHRVAAMMRLVVLRRVAMSDRTFRHDLHAFTRHSMIVTFSLGDDSIGVSRVLYFVCAAAAKLRRPMNWRGTHECDAKKKRAREKSRKRGGNGKGRERSGRWRRRDRGWYGFRIL